LSESLEKIRHLHDLITFFKTHCSGNKTIQIIESKSPIQCILVPGNQEVKKLAKMLQNDGLDVRPILNPTVAKGGERLRICIHAYNTQQELMACFDKISLFVQKEIIER
jgi:8-amino-7-oxononanoate synthase